MFSCNGVLYSNMESYQGGVGTSQGLQGDPRVSPPHTWHCCRPLRRFQVPQVESGPHLLGLENPQLFPAELGGTGLDRNRGSVGGGRAWGTYSLLLCQVCFVFSFTQTDSRAPSTSPCLPKLLGTLWSPDSSARSVRVSQQGGIASTHGSAYCSPNAAGSSVLSLWEPGPNFAQPG